MKIYFVTNSPGKTSELTDFLSTSPLAKAIEIVVYSSSLEEVLDSDIHRIVTHKAIQAYETVALPCVVEHSGLFMDALPGLPGGVGQLIWNYIGDRICGFLHENDTRAAVARSVIGYCDGRHVFLFSGETRGTISDKARGSYALNWDPIFIPEGDTRTYGEMGLAIKRQTSPVHKAWEAFVTAIVTGDMPPAQQV